MTQNGAQFQQVAYAPPAQPIIVQMQFGPNPVSHILIISDQMKELLLPYLNLIHLNSNLGKYDMS